MSNEPAPPGGSEDPFAPSGVTWNRVSPKLTTARYVTGAIWLGIPFVGAVVLGVIFGGWVWSAAAVLALLGAWIAWLVPRQVRAYGYAEREDDLLVRRGVMFRSLVVVPYGRMQFTDVSSGPLTRKLGIAEVKLHTASASTDATIPGLPEAEAARVKDRLTQLGEARLAGL
ncbi:MAG: PH domain-containing protein [Salana multivorans]|uniref:PH domain-containing protein n=1 Tax=Salana multivorans TaxID=120377 RepID=UPI000969C7F3|nr:PH domain-containing protein [Salana multivorans]MBN8880764.1 PH domain-containing protein [Salana multivorans]OJX97466.1 MAG: hypothetical protein BGO96_06065 [Micrococcales bacterium 73-15]